MAPANSPKRPVVIAIDGPAGAGKSTIAKELSKRLHYAYLDTGAMYRALTLKALSLKANLEDEAALIRIAEQTSIDLTGDIASGLKVFLDGKDVTTDIRGLEVTNNTFYIARIPGVRKLMVQWQRTMGEKQSLVVEGRDIGTVVFPQAAVKFYLDANLDERFRRRLLELREQGKVVEAKTLQKELKERDDKDLTRPVGPLKKAEDAVFIDSTHLSIEQVLDTMLEIIQKKTHG